MVTGMAEQSEGGTAVAHPGAVREWGRLQSGEPRNQKAHAEHGLMEEQNESYKQTATYP
jgi:hypothetical protein